MQSISVEVDEDDLESVTPDREIADDPLEAEGQLRWREAS